MAGGADHERRVLTRVVDLVDDVPRRLRSDQAQLAAHASGPFARRVSERLRASEQRIQRVVSQLRDAAVERR